jgi:hypothetical protein
MRFVLCVSLVAAMALGSLATSTFAADEKASAPPAPAAAPAATPAPAAAVPPAPMVNSVKILFDDQAKNDGQLVFLFTPMGGAAKTITVTIANKMKGREVCSSAATELTVGLGAGYKVDKDGDKIKISGKDKAKFSLTISSLTANGLSVRLI